MRPGFEDVAPSTEQLELALRERGLQAPGRVERLVAVLVTGKAVARSVWFDDAEVSEDDFERLLSEQPPAPNLDASRTATFRWLDGPSRDAKVGRCSECQYRPVDAKCPRCNGTRRVDVDGDLQQCAACKDGLAAPCSVCGGSRRAVSTRVAFGEDHVRPFARIFLPNVSQGLRQPLIGFFGSRTSVPDLLAIDLAEDYGNVDAYRGRRSSGEVRGHRADAALAHARSYVERIAKLPSLVAVRSLAFAWPFVVAGEVAALRDEAGALYVLP